MIDCNTCPHLNVTEEQQDRFWMMGNKKSMFPHICKKYNKRVLHYPYQEPMIHPCDECIKEKENNYEME